LQTKTGQYVADQISEAIELAGPKNVVQVVTDNASNCVSAGKLLEEK
jgi:hypothetical protein